MKPYLSDKGKRMPNQRGPLASSTLLAVVVVLLLTGCQRAAAPPPAMSPQVTAYLNHVMDIMEHRSINRRTIDWVWYRKRLFKLAEGAQTPADTYSAIRYTVRQLGDGHSQFIPPLAAGSSAPQPTESAPMPKDALLEGRIGYLWLPYLVGDGPEASDYAARLHTLIRNLDAQSPCGWIVDLSDNQGGNMWPMLAGIGPVLGAGEAGRFIDPDGVTTPWSYQPGQALLMSTPMAQVPDPYTVRHPDPPVAVITSKQTASSGEAITVAFRGRPNTRSFGEPTAGLSTGNETYKLSDGATLVLTEVVFADRTGATYGQAVEPDDRSSWLSSPPRERASAWLLAQPSCAAP